MDKKSIKKYKLGRGCVHNINYHLVWCTKRRAKVLTDSISSDLKNILIKKAIEIGIKIETIEIMPDHVHIFVSSCPTIPPHKILKEFKGASSNTLRKKYLQLLRIPCLWSGSYYCGSVGHVSDSVVKNYIENQKSK